MTGDGTQTGISPGPRRFKGTVLVVDDEAYVRDSLASLLCRRQYKVRVASGPAEALKHRLTDGVDAVVTDLKMPGEDGLSLLRKLAETHPGLPVIVLTGHGTVLSAVECMKAGAADYLLKPANPDELVLILDRVLNHSSVTREMEYLRSGAQGMPARPEPLGVSEAWQRIVDLVEIAAPTDIPVLLLGETGTGKEVVARLLHRKSQRARRAFVAVNCAAIPTELFESEFFGHRKGSFTSAIADREGRFRIAHRGTLLMDEINSLPERSQAKVLRVLQDGLFERVGDVQSTSVDVRVICATNTDLESEVQAGRFRADLFYRINVMTIHIPPLRERREDVAVLAQAFLEESCGRLNKPLGGIRADGLAALQRYHWPGNVRELRNVIERGVLLEKTDELTPASLTLNVTEQPGDESAAGLSLRGSLAMFERRLLRQAIQRANGVRREAARLLKIDERNLTYYLKKHGLMNEGKQP